MARQTVEEYRLKQRDAARRYRKTEKAKDMELRRAYGITLAERNATLAQQRGRCAICGTNKSSAYGKKDWCTDHCHERGAVRGILCNECNLLLGYARDNPTTLIAAASYLEQHEERLQCSTETCAPSL